MPKLPFLIVWFLLSPCAVVFLFHLAIDLRPTVLYELHKEQYEIESAIKTLSNQVHQLQNDAIKSEASLQQITDLQLQLKQKNKEFLRFEPKWKGAPEIFRPFVTLLGIMVILLALAATDMPIAVHLRLACLSSGTAVAIIMLVQWGMVALYALTWNAQISSIIFIISVLIGTLLSWYKSLPYFKSVFRKNVSR